MEITRACADTLQISFGARHQKRSRSHATLTFLFVSLPFVMKFGAALLSWLALTCYGKLKSPLKLFHVTIDIDISVHHTAALPAG